MIWKRGGHCSDTLHEPSLVQSQIGCESFPMPQSDIPQPVFSADLHGKLCFLQVDGLVGQNLNA
jgi:hypothetical protein